MSTQTHVVISRPGSLLSPQPITVLVSHGTDVGMTVTMPLGAFLAELAGTMAHPAPLLTRAQIERALTTAADAVVATMKHEAARVM